MLKQVNELYSVLIIHAFQFVKEYIEILIAIKIQCYEWSKFINSVMLVFFLIRSFDKMPVL